MESDVRKPKDSADKNEVFCSKNNKRVLFKDPSFIPECHNVVVKYSPNDRQSASCRLLSDSSSTLSSVWDIECRVPEGQEVPLAFFRRLIRIMEIHFYKVYFFHPYFILLT